MTEQEFIDHVKNARLQIINEPKCYKCVHYITCGVNNNDLIHPIYRFSCELGLINCDEHFEEETDV